MCGACGTAVPRHWSAPFLASQASRGTAARAVTALIGPRPTVVAVSAGFLICGATGATTVASDLGAVWQALDRLGVPRPATANCPVHVGGPVTLPAVRTGLLEVQLVLCKEAPSPLTVGDGQTEERDGPIAEQYVDGRDADPEDLIVRLHELSRSSPASAAPRAARLILRPGDLPRTLSHLTADPTRPYQLRLPPAPMSRDRPQQWPHAAGRPLSASGIPALLAWAAGRQGQDHPQRLAVHVAVAHGQSFELEMLHGVVIRAAVGLTTTAPHARSKDR